MASRCSWCNQITSAPVGGSAPPHQEAGKRTACPGQGKTTNPVK